jgi:two-component system nitrate/nitrite response regulator NarL
VRSPSADESLAIVTGGLAGRFATTLREACGRGSGRDLTADTETPEDLLNGVEAVGRSRRLLVVLSGAWLRDEGLALLIEVRRLNPGATVLLVGADLESLAVGHALRLGLRGLADPGMDSDRLGRALDVVASGELWISRQLLLEVVGLLAPRDLDAPMDVWLNLPSLTEREHEVLKKVLDGKANKTIAYELGISEKTVKIHLQNVYRKLGVHRRVDLLKAFADCRPAA